MQQLFLLLLIQIGSGATVYAQTQLMQPENYQSVSASTSQSAELTAYGFAANATGGFTIDSRNREAVRQFYNTVFQSSVNVPSGWTGNIDRCLAGDTSLAYKNATLRRINWYRAMAGVPADVIFDEAANQKAQQAALIMAANARLSHNPDRTWRCFSTLGADAARTGNLALGSAGAGSVSQYMADAGLHNFAVGHRRWLLFPQTQIMGTGDVEESWSAKANTLWVMGPRSATRPPVRDEFVAWPPPGFVPYDTVTARWSFSYPWADFSSATIRMTVNGKTMSTVKEDVRTGYGDNTLVWIPGGYSHNSRWQKPLADTTYEIALDNVRIAGVARSFNYTVTVFAPEPGGTDNTAAGENSGKGAPVVTITGGDRVIYDTDYRLDENVRLTASAYDSDGAVVRTQWLVAGQLVASGLAADLRLRPGVNEVTFRGTDNSGVSADVKALIRVEKPQVINGWASAYNGITPLPSLQLPLNNIGLIDTAAKRVYTCVAIQANGQPSALNGVERFDIVFDIVSLEHAIIRVRDSRAFNANQQTTQSGAQPSCSGTYDTVSRLYSDILVMDDETLHVEFYMHDETGLVLQLQNAAGVMPR